MNHRVARLLLLVALLPSSCAPRHEVERAQSAAIRTDHDRYVLRAGRFGEEVIVVATFTAPQDSAVYIVNCNGAFTWGLQQRDGERWTDAWIVATNACLSPPIVIPAGGVRTDTLTVVSRTDIVPDPGPVRHRIDPGTYRVAWYNVLTSFDRNARPFGPELPLEKRVSGPITIERAR